MVRRRRRGGLWEKPESEKKRILEKWRRLIPKILSKRKMRRGKGKIPFGSLALISGMMSLLQH